MNTKTTISRILFSGLIFSLLGFSAISSAYESFQGPTELIQYDPANAFEGLVPFAVKTPI